MADSKMIDNEDRREERKIQAGLSNPAKRFPNRKQRRLIAKRKGVFKHKGAWPYVNQGDNKNKPVRKEGLQDDKEN